MIYQKTSSKRHSSLFVFTRGLKYNDRVCVNGMIFYIFQRSSIPFFIIVPFHQQIEVMNSVLQIAHLLLSGIRECLGCEIGTYHREVLQDSDWNHLQKCCTKGCNGNGQPYSPHFLPYKKPYKKVEKKLTKIFNGEMFL